MRIQSVKVEGFRGFNQLREIDFPGDLILISGTNGMGKTSLVEALEWVLFGYTSRRRKGDSLSRREHAKSYRNSHYPTELDPRVVLTVEDSGQVHTIQRTLHSDESSTLQLNANDVSDLKTLGITNDRQKPFVIQHGLRDFIFTRPIDRYRALSGMLGLDSLISFRDAAERAKTEYRNSQDPALLTARRQLAEFRSRLAADSVLREFVDLFDAGTTREDELRAGVLRASTAATGETSADQKVHALRVSQKLADSRNRVFNLDALRPVPSGDWQQRELQRQRQRFAESSAKQLSALADELQAEKSEYDSDRIRFLSLGLKFLNTAKPAECPFCLNETLSDGLLDDYRREVAEADGSEKSQQPPAGIASRLRNECHNLLHETLRALVSAPNRVTRATLEVLLRETGADYREYLSSLVQTAVARRDAARFLRRMDSTLRKIEELEAARTFDKLVFEDYEGALAQLHTTVHQVEDARAQYEDAFLPVEQALSPIIASDSDVAHLALLEDLLNNWVQIHAGLSDVDTAARLQSLLRLTREFVEAKQRQILATKNDALVDWYGLLNPGEEIRFSGIDVATDSLLLTAESYGQPVSAAATLSEAHLNCLGLSVYLMQSIDPALPFRFVVIDDPIQSMDQDHEDRFADDLVKSLLDEEYQVIILSHLFQFVGSLRQLHRLKFPYCLEFASYDKQGPTIKEDVPPIQHYLRRAKENQQAAGREYRRECSRYIRLLVERFCKELYIEQTGTVIPRAYRAESFDRLRDLLRATSFDPSEESRLKNTFDFAVGSHHDDEEAEPPSPGQLQTHVSRIEGLIRKYGLSST